MPHNEAYLLVATSRTHPGIRGKLIGAKPPSDLRINEYTP